jgi:signal transduction histidine kinase/DNA-binding response OmpR family regulator
MPISSAPTVAEAPGSDPEPQVNILLVDDEPANLLVLETILANVGANLVKAHSGGEALRCLLHQDFALVLLDVQMHDMDGFETAALIRERARSQHLPIIFITAFQRGDSEIFKGYSLKAVDFLFKPFAPEVLKSKVAVFVDLHKKTEEVKRLERMAHERKLAETKRQWEAHLLREEMERERAFGDALSQRAAELARTVSERERAQDALRKTNERLTLLSETANRLLLHARPREILRELYGSVSARMGLEVYFNHLVDEERGVLRLDAHAGISPAVAEELRWLRYGEGTVGAVALGRAPVVAEGDSASSATTGAGPSGHPLGVSAYVAHPLLAQNKLVGTLFFGTRERALFDPEDLAILQVFCNQVAMALDRDFLITELQRRADALAETDRRKDEFLAMLAHELRNPLTPLFNALELMRDHSGGDPAVERARETMDRQTRHMSRLVDDLLDVSRITIGKIELRKEPIVLSAVVEQAVTASEPLVSSRRHALTVSLPDEPVRLVGDLTRLVQVFSNLLHNAVKYTDPGGSIRLTARREGDEVVCRVRDSGIGIAPEMLSRVFDLFVQNDRALDRSQGGLGIGLTIVRTLVEMHGGTITAESGGHGRGAEFVLRLPVQKESPAARKPGDARVPPAAMPTVRPLRILLVEDNVDVRESFRLLLQRVGHTIEEAQDGPEGVERVLALRPDVALIDIGLPGLNGYEVARKVRALAQGCPTRLIAMTGYGQDQDKQRALEAGFDAHLVKPVTYDKLVRTLAEVMKAPAAGEHDGS